MSKGFCTFLECYVCNKRNKSECIHRHHHMIELCMGVSYRSTLNKLGNMLLCKEISLKDYQKYCDILKNKLRYSYRPVLFFEKSEFIPSEFEIDMGKQRLANRMREVWCESRSKDMDIGDVLFLENIINLYYGEEIKSYKISDIGYEVYKALDSVIFK